IEAPTICVADRDEADPGHPLAIGEAYASAIPGAELLVEEEGKSPLAWQGSPLSKGIVGLAERARVRARPSTAAPRCGGSSAASPASPPRTSTRPTASTRCSASCP